MSIHPNWYTRALLIGVFLIMANTVLAQTQADLDAATLAANIAEQQKKAAEARRDAAVADTAATAATSKSASDVAKAKAEAEKSQIDTLKASLPTPPDPTKYKLEKPQAPTLNATIARLTFEQAKDLSSKVANSVAATLAPYVKSGNSDAKVPDSTALAKVVLLTDGGKVRTLLALSTATKEGILGVDTRVKALTQGLKDKKSSKPVAAFGPGALLMISSLLENVLAYASILRTQYGFTTASVTPTAEEALQALVQGELATWKVKIVDADALLLLPTDSSDLSGKLNALRNSVATAHAEARNSADWVKDKRETVPNGETELTKKARLALADEVERMATALEQTADDADKFIAALFVADAQGNTPFDAAMRGEALVTTLGTAERKLTLTLKVITSDADTVATDGFFSGFKVFAGNSTVVRWKLVGSDGIVIGSAAEMQSNGPTQIALSGK